MNKSFLRLSIETLSWVAVLVLVSFALRRFDARDFMAHAQVKSGDPVTPITTPLPVTGPWLKDNVALDVRNAEWEMAKLTLQIAQDQKAIDAAAAADAAAEAAKKELKTLLPQSQKAQEKYLKVLGEALKRSGYDDTYQLDGDTLAVTKKEPPK
jgi:hypothetical protein